jgi:hypothetical protein
LPILAILLGPLAYLLLKTFFLNFHLSQAQVTVADFGYPFWALWLNDWNVKYFKVLRSKHTKGLKKDCENRLRLLVPERDESLKKSLQKQASQRAQKG